MCILSWQSKIMTRASRIYYSTCPVGAFTVRGEEEGVEFHSLGQVAREVSGANELWLALVLTHDALQTLGPPQLAGGWFV